MTALGAPDYELTRSPAAARVGRLARDSHLFLANFEHRVELPLPEAWLPEGRADLGAPPTWLGASLPESKYHSFRHERRIGSFHPGQRSKWTAHELCHAAIGFAWRPDGSVLFHALAARLAEALPVALWYFLDEDGLRRCPDHRGNGPLFDAYCARCEAAHREGPDDSTRDPTWLERGHRFVEREIEASMASLRAGRMIPSRYATLDLGTDGLAYAAANLARLRSPTFAGYVSAFFPAGTGHHHSLEALIGRVREVTRDLVGGAPAAPLTGSRALWMAQDVAWRLLQVREETDGDAAVELERLVERLASAPTLDTLAACLDDYCALESDFELPGPELVFAVGYDLPGGHGRGAAQLAAGIRSGLPATAALLGSELESVAARFVAVDVPVREPLGRRFARFLAGEPAAPLAAYEAALAHAPPPDLEAITLAPDVGGGELVLSRSAEFVRAPWDVAAYAAAVDAGRAARRRERPGSWVVTRAADADVLVIPIDEALADQLAALPGELDRTPAVEELIQLGVLAAHPSSDG